MANRIHVVCATDDNYAVGLACTLFSANRNLGKDSILEVYVCYASLSAKVMHFLQDLADTSEFAISFRCLDDSQLGGFKSTISHLSKSAYIRLFIPELIPDAKRVIYLDSDLLVTGDLADLWESSCTCLHPVAAFPEKRQSDVLPVSILDKLKIDPEAPYFNSGVLVLDLERIRSNRYFQKAIELNAQSSAEFSPSDQDLINMALWDRILPLDRRWNTKVLLTQACVHLVPRHGDIIHFIGRQKPWMFAPDGTHGVVRLYFRYLKNTGYEKIFESKDLVHQNIPLRQLVKAYVRHAFQGLFSSGGN